MDLKLNSEELKIGENMLTFAKELFPLNRSIMGPDIRKSYNYFCDKHKEFKKIYFNSGDMVFDWKIPLEWIIRDAYIEHESGIRFAEFSKNNLHIMGYSEPVNLILSKKELIKRIYISEKIHNAIPYVTSYYKKDWAFCMSKEELLNLPEGKYKVFIDSEFVEGKLVLLEAKIPGNMDREIFFSSYLCHPSMANNELSGPVLLSEIMNYTKSIKNRKYSYRFVLLPETIGSIAYLSKNKNLLKQKILCGFNLSCVGDEKGYSHISSRLGNNLADKALDAALIGLSNQKKYSFLERGSDERQYCSPGIDLPICTFSKSKFGEFDEYHTSKDNFKIVTAKGLSESFKIVKNIINSFEMGINPKINVFCEPQLGKRGLYPNKSLPTLEEEAKTRMNIISYCDGMNSIFDIAKILNKNLEVVIEEIKKLNNAKLINFD